MFLRYLAQIKQLVDYAKTFDIEVGGYVEKGEGECEQPDAFDDVVGVCVQSAQHASGCLPFSSSHYRAAHVLHGCMFSSSLLTLGALVLRVVVPPCPVRYDLICLDRLVPPHHTFV